MKKSSWFILLVLALALSPLIVSAQCFVESYWPMHDGDTKTYVDAAYRYTLLFETAGNQYPNAFALVDSDSGYAIYYGYSGSELLRYAEEAGWMGLDFYPPVVELNDTVLMNGGSISVNTVTYLWGYEIILTGTVRVSLTGTVTVPAGTFYNCRTVVINLTATIPGEGSDTFAAENYILAPGVGMIRCRFTDENNQVHWLNLESGTVGGMDVAALAVLTTNMPPRITTQPRASLVVTNNAQLALGVTASGGGLAYQWLKDGQFLCNDGRVTGADTSALRISPVGPDDAGAYTVLVQGDTCWVESSPAWVTVVPDPVLPMLTIKQPSPGQRWSNELFTVTGTARDNVRVAAVWCRVNHDEDWQLAGTTNSGSNWTAVVTLAPGTNTVSAYAADAEGNHSLTNAVKLFRVLTTPLGVTIVGNGKVTGATNGQAFELGKTVALTVTPGTGWVLTNWLVQVNGNTTLSSNKAVPFLMASNTVVTATFVDVAKPTLTLTAPTANQRWSNEVFTVKGKVTDNSTNGTVWYQLNGGAWTNASGWTNWLADVLLVPGTNNVKAYAQDAAGNRSTTNSVNVIRVLTTPLGVTIVGNGKVTGATNGQPFEIGKSVTLTATPSTGWILTNWLVQVNGNTTLSSNKAVSFLMASNTVVTATFVDVAKPTLTITAPTANQRWSNQVFTVKGKVTDNNSAGAVWYQLNGGAWTNASGWTNWLSDVLLVPGTNNVKAYAQDAAGNRSTTNSVNVIRVLTTPLGLTIVGNGKVTGATNGQPFEMGKSVALTVTPGTGWVLTNWLVQVNGNTTLSSNKAVPFLMASNTVVTATFVDVAKPTLTLTAPTANQRWSNEVFTVKGKVTDNSTNGTVWYQLNGGAWTNASGWTNWLADVLLVPGTNNVKAYAQDAAGNRSTTNSVNVIRVLTTPLGVTIVGNGKVTGATNGQPFEIGKSVTLTATPSTGWILTNWLVQVAGNTTISSNKAVPFLMASNTVVTATFVDVAKPTLTLTAPTANQRWSNEVFTVKGKVTDSNTNGMVWCQLNGGAWTNASGWINWLSDVLLVPGTNNVKAYAVDAAGNRSATNSANVIYVFTYCLSDYFHPAPVGTHLIYDGLDWDGFPAQLKVEIQDDNYPLDMYAGTTTVTRYTTNVLKAESAYGTYNAGTGQFFPYDEWDEYFISEDCSFGYMGSDDGFESVRADRGFVWTNRMAVGQTLSLTRNIYLDGDYVGQGTVKVQLLDVSTVTVPAGTYPSCLRLRLTITLGGQSESHDEWLAPGVGMVKAQGVSGDGAAERWELIVISGPSLPAPLAASAAQEPIVPAVAPSVVELKDAIFDVATAQFSFRVAGPAGLNVTVEFSDDCSRWTPLQNVSLGEEGVQIIDPVPPGTTQRFYRVVGSQ
jgi:hypothetical protein